MTCRATDTPAFLFNFKADTRGDAVQYGRALFKRLPFGSPIPELYSLRNCHAIMMDEEQARQVDHQPDDEDDDDDKFNR